MATHNNKMLSKHNGTKQIIGATAGQTRNGYEIWLDNEGNKYIKMDVLKNGETFQTLFDYEDLPVIKDSKTWYVMTTGYVARSSPFSYLHHLVMNFEGTGKGFQDLSVDHINRDKLDNRKQNLRLATSKEQQQNSKGQLDGTKRERNKDAKKLPNGVTELPKYVIYYSENIESNAATLPDNPEQGYRDFFRIEKHPAQLTKPPLFKNKWATSKSILSMTPKDKLLQAIDKLKEMDLAYTKFKSQAVDENST